MYKLIMFKYHYFYKITNIINNHFYYGAHSTNNLNDHYFGSGIKLKEAIKKYGKENFKLEIIKFFNTREELSEYEFNIVNEDLIKSKECYNICPGGLGSFNSKLILVYDKLNNCKKFVNKEEFDNNENYESYNKGKLIVKDKEGNIFRINVDDPRYISGELVHNTKGTTIVTINGINKRISNEEYKLGNYESPTKGHVQCIDEYGNNIMVTTEEFRNNKNLKSIHKGKITIKDQNGNYKSVDVTDEKYLNGEYEYMFKGTKNFINVKTGEVKRLKLNDPILETGEWIGQNVGKQIVKDKYGNTYKLDKNDPRILSGELVPNRLGNKHSEETKKKIGLYGKGRIWINNGIENKFIKPEEFINYIGYKKGKLTKKLT